MSLPIAVANVPENIDGVLNRGEVIINKITGSTDIVNPVPTVAVFTTNVNTLRTTNTAVQSGTGSVQARDAALEVVKQNIKSLLRYVQGVADANPSRGGDIIINAGFFIRESSKKSPQTYHAESEEPGQITIITPATEGKLPIVIEYSTNSGETWSLLRVSRLSVCTVEGLTSGQEIYVRYHVVSEDNSYGPYSSVISCRIR